MAQMAMRREAIIIVVGGGGGRCCDRLASFRES